MSLQTDQLYLQFPEDREAIELDKEVRAKQIAESVSKLRALQDLLRTPSFQVFVQQLRDDQRSAFSSMERASDSHANAQASGAYCAITRAIEWPQEEIDTLVTFIKSAERGK